MDTDIDIGLYLSTYAYIKRFITRDWLTQLLELAKQVQSS